ncbi:hypothetical protein BJX99DRAFT_263389 [Aspergillus californicus]
MLGQARSRQDLASKPKTSLTSSPSHRRVTRSQSRDVEDDRDSFNESSRDNKYGNQSKLAQRQDLTPVIEESSLTTPHKSTARRKNAVVLESPEDAANISGTTILPSDAETDLDSEMILETLPDLEHAANNVLDFLIPSATSPAAIVNKAKLLSDPKNTQSRRLGHLRKNLATKFEYFGSNDDYIDADKINHIFLSALAGRRGQHWSPTPILHKANCARFTVEILLAGTTAHLQKQAIRKIEALFPLPFMAGLSQQVTYGESALERDTFDLALEIRTQSLISLLDDHQHDPGFDPKNDIQRCFFQGLSRKSPLRGFNLPNFGGINSALPKHYQDIVQQRLNDILVLEDDGLIDVEGLRGAYHWQQFVLRVVQWLRKRIAELYSRQTKQMSAQDIKRAFFDLENPSFTSTLGGSDVEPRSKVVGFQRETPQQELVEHGNTTPQEQQEQQPEPRTTHGGAGRRQASKPSYNDPASIKRLMELRQRYRSVSEVSSSQQPSPARPASPTLSEQSANGDHQIPTGLLPSRTTRPDGLRVIPPSRDASPTLVNEIDTTINDDTPLDLGDDNTQIERSHSPPGIRGSSALARGEATSTHRRQVPTAEEIYEAMTRPSQGPSHGPRFIDRQDRAQRVSPIRESGSQDAVRHVEERASRKRARPASDTESDTDSAIFDYDGRAPDINRRRAEKPQQSRTKRARVQAQDTNTDVNFNEDNDEDGTQRELQRPLMGRREPGLVSPIRRSSTTVNKRRYWTKGEDNRLMRLLREIGPHWSRIERENQSQEAQDDNEARIDRKGNIQVQLKDRARNIKIKHYRDGTPMPRCLEGVTMKIQDFMKLGIPVPIPEQR